MRRDPNRPATDGRPGQLAIWGKEGTRLLTISNDGYEGPYLRHQLARICLLVGEPEKALDHLEPLLRIPYFLSPAWVKIDPTFGPLHGNPRFERLASGS